jgi:hypothetical protein
MTEDKQRTYRGVRRFAKIVLMVAIPLFLLLTVLWHIIRSDHKLVIEQIRSTALEHLDLQVDLDGYRLEWAMPYPLIRFQLHNLSIASANHPQMPVFQANSIISEFNPWDLLTGDFQAHPLEMDSVWVYLYTDSVETKRELAERKTNPGGSDGIDWDLAELPSISVNYLDFHRRDDFKDKWQWAKFSHFEMHPRAREQGDWIVHLQSSCYFEGLVFKDGDGGFLMNTPSEIDWQFALADEGKTLQLLTSTLSVDQNTFTLQGRFQLGDPRSIQLQIVTDGVTMEEALPLLSDKVNNVLCNLQIDQPIQTEFSLDNTIVPGRKEAIEIVFATHDAAVNYKDVSMTSATLRGTFSNDCDEDGVGDPLTSCITFDQLDGDIYGVLPARLEGVISNMEDPHVEAIGQMEVDLPRLNSLLTSKGKATFATGTADVNFNYVGILRNLLDAPFEGRNIHVDGNATFKDVRLATAGNGLSSPLLSGYLSFDEHQTLLEDMDLKWMGANIRLSGRLSKLPEFFFYDDQAIISDLVLHFDRVNLDRFVGKSEKPHKTGDHALADSRRVEELCRRLAENVNGQVLIRVDELRYDTFYVNDLQTHVRLFSPRKDNQTAPYMIRLDSLTGRFMGNVPVFAGLRLSGDEIPKVNIDLDLASAVRPARLLLPKDMKISGGDARLQLAAQTTLRSFLESRGMPADLQYEGFVYFDDLSITHTALAEGITHITGPLRLNGRQLRLDDLRFQYQSSPFALNGKIDHYYSLGKEAGQKAVADLKLSGQELDLRKMDQDKNEELISPRELFRSLDPVFRQISGKVRIALDAVKTDKQSIEPFLVRAALLPDSLTDQYQLRLDSFHLGLSQGSYFAGDAVVKNPEEPCIQANLNAKLEFEQLAKLLPSEYLEMQSGKLLMDLQYQSPLHDSLNAGNYLLNAEIDGNARIENGKLFYNYRDFNFEDISGHFRFDQRALYINDLELKVNGNQLSAQGQSSDFFPFFILPDRRANITLKVTSPRFDFGEFTAPHGLGKDTLRRRRETVGRSYQRSDTTFTADTTRNTLKRTAGYIDQLLDRGTLDMSTDLEEVVYQKFKAHTVGGRITLAPDTVELHNLQMNVAEGHLAVAGHISNIVRHEPKMEISVEMDQNNVREIFRQFNDFGQQELNHKNIKGLISADLHFTADINSNYDILPASMHGDLGLKLAGGELIDLKAFRKKSGFLFRNRGLDHVILDTLELDSHIRGSDLFVDNFYLHSSSFDFGAIGRYSLGANKHTRILLTIPIRNFFQRHISTEDMRAGESERKGMNILIEARYRKGKMRMIWRPLILNKDQFKLEEEPIVE